MDLNEEETYHRILNKFVRSLGYGRILRDVTGDICVNYRKEYEWFNVVLNGCDMKVNGYLPWKSIAKELYQAFLSKDSTVSIRHKDNLGRHKLRTLLKDDQNVCTFLIEMDLMDDKEEKENDSK